MLFPTVSTLSFLHKTSHIQYKTPTYTPLLSKLQPHYNNTHHTPTQIFTKASPIHTVQNHPILTPTHYKNIRKPLRQYNHTITVPTTSPPTLLHEPHTSIQYKIHTYTTHTTNPHIHKPTRLQKY
jgi:hypothetical protein